MVTRQEFINRINNAQGKTTSRNNDFMEEDLGSGD
jgi:hypothetical protein